MVAVNGASCPLTVLRLTGTAPRERSTREASREWDAAGRLRRSWHRLFALGRRWACTIFPVGALRSLRSPTRPPRSLRGRRAQRRRAHCPRFAEWPTRAGRLGDRPKTRRRLRKHLAARESRGRGADCFRRYHARPGGGSCLMLQAGPTRHDRRATAKSAVSRRRRRRCDARDRGCHTRACDRARLQCDEPSPASRSDKRGQDRPRLPASQRDPQRGPSA
jgi:hypothetical protein